MEWIQTNAKELLAVLGALVALATAVVKLTPTQKDEQVLGKIIKVLSALSLCNPDGSFSK
ncbi:MAG: hypothetical protein IKC13_00125 [Elusimicrobiaceae bacterium]|nr:hypothetical protein [Elusimicrobiaceae bacterium]